MMSAKEESSRLLKKAHLRRFPHPRPVKFPRGGTAEADLTGQVIASRSSLRDSLLCISGALDLDVFEQPVSRDFFSNLLGRERVRKDVSPV